MKRRTFIKTTAVGGGAAAALGFDLGKAHAEMRQYKIARTTETRSTCPYCAVSCGVIIHTLGDNAGNVKASVVHVQVPEDVDDTQTASLIRDELPVRYMIVPCGRQPSTCRLAGALNRSRVFALIAQLPDGDRLYEVKR